MNIVISTLQKKPLEVVERKGTGHPDTLCDSLAELLSVTYSKYTLKNFSAILNHNFDKLIMMGGITEVKFGYGKIISPIRVVINGRASTSFGNIKIPVQDLLIAATKRFLQKNLPMVDPDKNIKIFFEVSDGSSPGAVNTSPKSTRQYWFQPRNLADITNHKLPKCNDTSSGCGYYPFTQLENLVLKLELLLNSEKIKKNRPWLGSDIKIMGHKQNNEVNITLAVPQMCTCVNDLKTYKNNLEDIFNIVKDASHKEAPNLTFNFTLNARDNYDIPELYLTYTGSSIENGDEGCVGRGNRMQGLISSYRPFTMEGISGKNPVYHTGKLYCVASYELAKKLYVKTGIPNEVTLIGKTGQDLSHPWQINVSFANDNYEPSEVKQIIASTLDNFSEITNKIIKQKYRLA